MGWSVHHNKEENVMVLTYQNVLSFRDIVASSITNINQANEHGSTKMLVDCIYLKLDANRSEIFELPSNLYAKWGMNPTTRIALLEPRDLNARSTAEFYVFATQNLGWFTKMFKSSKMAMEWLHEK